MGRKKIGDSRKKRRESDHKAREISSRHILELLEGKGYALLLKEILQELGLKRDRRRELKDFLEMMFHEGKVVRIHRNRYALPSKMNLVVGRVKCHPDGYGFVISEKEGEEDVFIGPRNLREAMHGDRVVASIESVRKKGKEGKIVRVLERKTRKVVGKFAKERDHSYVIPDDEKMIQEIYIPEGDQTASRIRRRRRNYRTHGEDKPEGRVTHLGFRTIPRWSSGHPAKYDLLWFPSAAQEEDASSISPIPLSTGARRSQEVPPSPSMGEGEDFDDAVSIEERDGGLKLYVSISDVSHYVKEGTALDEEAYLRGTSVYFPDRTLSMFPAELSNEICCLHPGVDRLTLTAELRYDRHRKAQGVRFYPSVIRSDERLTYTLVRRMLVDGEVEVRDKYRHLLPPLEKMASLAQELRQQRVNRGALDFDLPEPEVVLDLQGETRDIIRAERNMAHQIIEEFMIAANEAVASFMEEKRLPFIYRIHEPPNQEAIEEFRRFVSALGFRMKRASDHSPKEFQRILSEAKGRTEEKVINNVLLRSMKWAKYSSQNQGHFGLASEAYTHFTSPIRRYPDLIVHRLLKRALSKREGRMSEEDLARKADHLSQRERVSMEAEREIVDRDWIRLMKKDGRGFEGSSAGGLFRFLCGDQEVFVRLVKVTSLATIPIVMMKTYCLMGDRTHRVRIGDGVKVKLARVDVDRRQIDFVLVK
jgi:ribonuclease R